MTWGWAEIRLNRLCETTCFRTLTDMAQMVLDIGVGT
jgi:hypothetical protein